MNIFLFLFKIKSFISPPAHNIKHKRKTKQALNKDAFLPLQRRKLAYISKEYTQQESGRTYQGYWGDVFVNENQTFPWLLPNL